MNKMVNTVDNCELIMKPEDRKKSLMDLATFLDKHLEAKKRLSDINKKNGTSFRLCSITGGGGREISTLTPGTLYVIWTLSVALTNENDPSNYKIKRNRKHVLDQLCQNKLVCVSANFVSKALFKCRDK